jgi:hypothetical protein
MSLLFDVRILRMTFLRVVQGDGVRH